MDHPSSGFETQDDYLSMDQMTITSDPDYLVMDKGYQDPLIADYLTMDDMENRQKFDDYPTNGRPTGEIIQLYLLSNYLYSLMTMSTSEIRALRINPTIYENSVDLTVKYT